MSEVWQRQMERQRHLNELATAARDAIEALITARPVDPDEIAILKEELKFVNDETSQRAKENADLKARNKQLSQVSEAGIVERLGHELQIMLNENRQLRNTLEAAREAAGRITAPNAFESVQSRGVVHRGGFYVYQLFDNSLLVYVGQSASLMSRMPGHKDKTWTHVVYQQCLDNLSMRQMESDLIHGIHPKYNRHCPVCGRINQESSEALPIAA